jgi:ABC-type transport system involved in multi-copper enzyme maturation permease subunit
MTRLATLLLQKFRAGLPLLTRELIEQANRPRTYGIRVAYAVILFFISASIGTSFFAAMDNDPLALLGQGRQMFMFLAVMQFIALYLLVPAMSAGAITSEKEKNTIGLLLISRLGPWTIIFEKLLGRLIPIGMCLLVSMPLMAVLFAIGGMTQSMIWSALYLLLVTALQCASVAVMCSAICRTTTSAFLWTIVVGYVWILGMPTLHLLFLARGPMATNSVVEQVVYAFLTPYLLVVHAFSSGVWSAFLRSIPILAGSGICLWIAKLALVPRALINTPPMATQMAKALREVTGDVVRQHSADPTSTPRHRRRPLTRSLPADHPVAWRQARLLLGNRKFAFGSGCLLTVGVAMLCLMALAVADADWSYALIATPWVLMLMFTCLVACARSSGLITSERNHQTLDILLATPLSMREIVLEKQAAVRRLSLAMALPMSFLIWFAAVHRGITNVHNFESVRYLVAGLGMTLIYPSVCSWLSFAVALRRKDDTGSLVAGVILTLGWAVLPLIGYMLYYLATWVAATDLYLPTVQLSPLVFIAINEGNEWDEFNASPWLTVSCHFGLQIAAIAFFRWWSLSRASRMLSRGDSGLWVPPDARPSNLRVDDSVKPAIQ